MSKYTCLSLKTGRSSNDGPSRIFSPGWATCSERTLRFVTGHPAYSSPTRRVPSTYERVPYESHFPNSISRESLISFYTPLLVTHQHRNHYQLRFDECSSTSTHSLLPADKCHEPSPGKTAARIPLVAIIRAAGIASLPAGYIDAGDWPSAGSRPHGVFSDETSSKRRDWIELLLTVVCRCIQAVSPLADEEHAEAVRLHGMITI